MTLIRFLFLYGLKKSNVFAYIFLLYLLYLLSMVVDMYGVVDIIHKLQGSSQPNFRQILANPVEFKDDFRKTEDEIQSIGTVSVPRQYSASSGVSVARLSYVGNLFLARDSEPAFIVDVRLRRTHICLARYRSPGKITILLGLYV